MKKIFKNLNTLGNKVGQKLIIILDFIIDSPMYIGDGIRYIISNHGGHLILLTIGILLILTYNYTIIMLILYGCALSTVVSVAMINSIDNNIRGNR